MNRRPPRDVCRCPGDECPLRWDCARFRSEGGAWVPTYAFAPWQLTSDGPACQSFLPVDNLVESCGSLLSGALSGDGPPCNAITDVDHVVVGLGQSGKDDSVRAAGARDGKAAARLVDPGTRRT